MALVLIDTNILIDYLKGHQGAIDELAKYQDKAISIVTWIEVLAGTSASLEAPTKAALAQFLIIDCAAGAVADQALAVRRASLLPSRHRLRLPDAIILATAISQSRTLLTRNTKDFKPAVNVQIPYVI